MSPSFSQLHPFLPFDVCLLVSVCLSCAHTEHFPHPHMSLCCCVWLVSGKKGRRVGAPEPPRGQPEAPGPSEEALEGAPRLLSAPLIADVFLPFEICAVTCSVRWYTHTNKHKKEVCAVLHGIAFVCHCLCSQAVVVVMLLLCLLVCLQLHNSGERPRAR